MWLCKFVLLNTTLFLMNIIFIAEESALFTTHKANQHPSQRIYYSIGGRNQRTYSHLCFPGPIGPQVHSILFPCSTGLCRLHFPGFSISRPEAG